MRRTKARHELVKDVAFILIGVAIAVFLAEKGLIDAFIHLFGNPAVASFVAGIFFTSAFTIAPSSIALARIIESTPIQTVALWGALGALCGDLVLFFFIRDKFAEDLKNSFRPSFVKHVFSSFHFGFLKWLSPILGAFIIASPLPDELGLALMGLSKVRVALLVPVSFIMNMVGIYALTWFVHSI